MSTDLTLAIASTNSGDTEQLGEQLGQKLKGGEVIELVSDLGGGKTTFVRGLARGIGSQDKVASPTFTISKVYKGYVQNPEALRLDTGQGAGEKRTEPYTKYDEGVSESATPPSAKSAAGADGFASRQSSTALSLWHFDFYRLKEAGLIEHELADVLGDPKIVIVVEWGNVISHVLPASRLSIQITNNGENSRNFEISYPEELSYLIEDL